jgi:8-oxo-dGTP pyrophosphatase MutT (NUDIX family)
MNGPVKRDTIPAQAPPNMYGSAVTNRTRVRVGVGVIVWNGEREVLLEKRRDCRWWGLPGGRVEPGESICDAAVREVYEETGLTVGIRRLLGVYSEPSGRIVTFPDNGDMVHLVDVIVEACIHEGHLRPSEESEEVRFFPVDQLPFEIVPPARQPLIDAIAGQWPVLR